MAEKSTGKTLKALRSDNRGEYTSLEFESYLKEEGIVHQLTIPKSPQQNGVAERLNRTVMNMVRSMLAVYKMPQRFWAEALNTAVYLRNRSPTTAVEGKTPFESLTGKKPKVGHLRIFGCAAYRHVMDDERRKLDTKTEKCVFLGYSENRKGYRLFDTRRQKVIHSRDVVFDETFSGLKDVKEDKYVQIRLGTDEEDNEGNTVETTESDATEAEETPSTVTPIVRRSGRNRHPPDFYGVYVNMADVNSEPLTIQEALSGEDKRKWEDAMAAEYESLQANDVWDLVKPSENTHMQVDLQIFWQLLMEKEFFNHVVESFSSTSNADGAAVCFERKLTDVEENAIRYTAGAVIRKLEKKYTIKNTICKLNSV